MNDNRFAMHPAHRVERSWLAMTFVLIIASLNLTGCPDKDENEFQTYDQLRSNENPILQTENGDDSTNQIAKPPEESVVAVENSKNGQKSVKGDGSSGNHGEDTTGMPSTNISQNADPPRDQNPDTSNSGTGDTGNKIQIIENGTAEEPGNTEEHDNAEDATNDSMMTADESVAENGTEEPDREIKLLIEENSFKVEGPEDALRISYDDFDLLKVLNMEPVPTDAVSYFPDWLKDLNGKRVRVRGFMYPEFQATGLKRFTLARDNDICCFGRDPKIYDLVGVTMRSGETTDYIQGRPFDVVGIFKIDPILLSGDWWRLYHLEDAIVIDRRR